MENASLLALKLAKREKQLEDMAVNMSVYNEKIQNLTEENETLKDRIAELEKKLANRVINYQGRSAYYGT